jgi:hypothetical protein
MNKWE